jgi:hypothetical protein
MAKGIAIYDDNSYEIKEFKHLDDYKNVVNGWIERLAMYSVKDGQSGSIYVNEEGKIEGLKLNRTATLIAWLGSAMYSDDVIVGNAIILGKDDGEGGDTDVDQMWIDIASHHCTERKSNV